MSGVRKEAAVRLLEAENRAQPAEAAMFRSITRLEVFLERIWTESSFGSRARGTPWGIVESAVEDAGDGHARQRMG